MKPSLKYTILFIDIAFFIFVFIIGIKGLSESLTILLNTYLEGSLLYTFLKKLSNPYFGLFVGILNTALIQSSSTITATALAIVSSGALSIRHAIPILLGANLGTTITNTLVALFQGKKHKKNFEKALAASTLHDFYNIITLLIIFPFEITYHPIEKAAFYFYTFFFRNADLSLQFQNPLTNAIDYCTEFVSSYIKSPILLLIIFVVLIMLSLAGLVQTLKKTFLTQVKKSLSKNIFSTKFKSWASGVLCTMTIQSSSVTTSLVIPLAATNSLHLEQIYPYTVGANIGTGLTAFIAALSLNPLAMVAALFSLIFDIVSTVLVFLNPLISHLPIYLAQKFGYYGSRYKQLPVFYIILLFIILPIVIIRL